MVGFLRWLRSIAVGTLNGIVRFVFLLILIFVAFAAIGLMVGDGLPKNMVLALDLRGPIADSRPAAFAFGAQPVTVMDIVLGLDAAERDPRVKGVVVRVGSANISIANAEEIGTADLDLDQDHLPLGVHAHQVRAPAAAKWHFGKAPDVVAREQAATVLRAHSALAAIAS